MIVKAREIIEKCDAVLILAGAGMGIESGLPDFRGNEGFWKAYSIAKQRKLSFEELANPEWFKSEPSLAWAFYGHRLNIYRAKQFHTSLIRINPREAQGLAGTIKLPMGGLEGIKKITF
ncbi:MAG: hypothetical protein QG617_759 [Campylobacterota bacterium]|nr:hypothetical protein [Campylobacterota bacterium]